MNNVAILDAIGMINEEAVRDAKAYQRPKSRSWIKWGTVAACLCLVIVGAVVVPKLLDDPAPMGFETVVEIEQNHNNATYLAADYIYRPSAVQVEEPQLKKQFASELEAYAVVSETVFSYENVAAFAEKAKAAGWLGDYAIDTVENGFVIVNEAVSNSQKMENVGGNDITAAFMLDSGISKWLDENGISVIQSPWFTDTYHLVLDGNIFADYISFCITDNGTVESCTLNMKKYAATNTLLPILDVETALENSFFIDENQTLNDEEMYIANVQLMHKNGLPIYFFTGSTVDGVEVNDDSYNGYAFAFTVDDSTTERVAEIIDSLTE